MISIFTIIAWKVFSDSEHEKISSDDIIPDSPNDRRQNMETQSAASARQTMKKNTRDTEICFRNIPHPSGHLVEKIRVASASFSFFSF